jgi:hypothetical protein
MSVDNVLEWEVVTASGEHLTATPDRHTDLYWALSGGGGGTYAALLSMTVRAHPDSPVTAANLTFTYAADGGDEDVYENKGKFYEAVAVFLTSLPRTSSSRWDPVCIPLEKVPELSRRRQRHDPRFGRQRLQHGRPHHPPAPLSHHLPRRPN